MTQQKTYWHFHEQSILPTEYALLSSKLLYYPTHGFAIASPIKQWYLNYQKISALHCDDWELFNDPRQTTYASYITLQNKQHIYINEIFSSIELSDYDRNLSSAWLHILENSIAILRYPCHALAMLSAYNGQMIPSSRLVIALLFQSADETRRVQTFAYRMGQLQKVLTNFGHQSKTQWQQDPLWQPLRQIIEKMLVVYDWNESLIILNFCLKPLFDYVYTELFADIAIANNDYLFAQILKSLQADCHWHQAWSKELLKILLDQNNETIILKWLIEWQEQILQSLRMMGNIFKNNNIEIQLTKFYNTYLISCGFKTFP